MKSFFPESFECQDTALEVVWRNAVHHRFVLTGADCDAGQSAQIEREFLRGFRDRQVLGILAPTLQKALGWDELEYSHIVMAFQAAYAIGLLGFGRLVFWYWLYMPPAQSRRVTAAELAYIHSDPSEPVMERIPWSELQRYRQTWAFVVAISLTAPIWWFFLYWLPKFLNQQYHLDLASMGPPFVVIYTMTSVGSIVGGWLPGYLL